MVSPYYLLGIGLGLAFLLGLLGKKAGKLSSLLVLAALFSFVGISFSWLWLFIQENATTAQFYSAGFNPPFSISLQVGLYEAIIASMINVLGLFSFVFLWKNIKVGNEKLSPVFLILFMGLNILVLTRDIFNIFVFLEITAIALGGLILLDAKKHAHSAGFKYLLASSLISALYLLGAVLVYFTNGTLFIDDVMLLNNSSPMALIAVFLLIIAVVLELKPFPANGWALDVYQGAHPAIGAIVSSAVGTTMLFLLYKLMGMAAFMQEALIAMGLLTFVAANVLGLIQKSSNRLLGYSSLGQIGLIVSVIGLQSVLGEEFLFIAFMLLITHFLAKAGLFWLSSMLKSDELKAWSVFRSKSVHLVLFGTFIFALIGFPPFPSFYGKWTLIMNLSTTDQYYIIAAILAGSFFEAIYLFRWLGYAIKVDFTSFEKLKISWEKLIPVSIFAIVLYGSGAYVASIMPGLKGLNLWPLLFIAVIYLLDFLPAYIKNTLSIAALAYYSYTILPPYYENDLLRFVFLGIFVIGGILTLIAGYAYKGKRRGFYPVALMMYAGLVILIQAKTTFSFFLGWELMTAGSYFLIIRGKRSMTHGLSYMLFSIGGAYAILVGLGMTFGQTYSIDITSLALVTVHAKMIFLLLAVGFLTKTAALGLHIWLPGAHAEAESDVSPMVSAILLKAGVFGLIILMIAMGKNPEVASIAYVLGWVGALSALVGNLAAAFQEDAKRLLAYSSIAQLGYILFALSMMSHLGWMTAMIYSINHFLYKSILFLTIGAVVLRVGTHSMHKMGGLIKRMPLAFIAVLIGIIALSGIPPLSGFAGKWFFYNAILEKGWYFQGAIVLFSGTVAFLYLFKLIHSVFLGQLKDNLRQVKDISVWFAIPVYVLIMGIMFFSAKPEWVLQPLSNMLSQWYPQGSLSFNGLYMNSEFGYWSGNLVMITIVILFVALLAWLWVLSRRVVRVKQFNIVYSAEAPQRPETTHMSYNLFAGYNKALGWIVAPKITEFWNKVSDFVMSVSHFGRMLYTGNGQTYLVHIVAYFVLIFFWLFN